MSDVKTVAYLPGTVIDNKSWAHPDGAYQIPVVLRSDLEASEARAQRLEAVLRELVESHDEDDVDSDDKTISGAEFVRRLDAAMTRRKAAWAAARAVSKE